MQLSQVLLRRSVAVMIEIDRALGRYRLPSVCGQASVDLFNNSQMGLRFTPAPSGCHVRRSAAGLAQIDALLEHGELANYYRAHAARADMYRRPGRTAEARSCYEKALALTQQEPERQFLQERIRQLN